MNESEVLEDFVVLERMKYEPAREYTIRCLDHNIIFFKLKPGQFISEKAIADIIGVSRTPAHEAIFDLSRKGMIDIYPQRGSMISFIDEQRVMECGSARLSLESLAVANICSNFLDIDFSKLEENIEKQEKSFHRKDSDEFFELDSLFHEQIFNTANKAFTWYFLHQMQMSFDRVRMLNLMNTDNAYTLNDHVQLLDYMKNGKKEEAVHLLENHIGKIYEDLKSLKEAYPSYYGK